MNEAGEFAVGDWVKPVPTITGVVIEAFQQDLKRRDRPCSFDAARMLAAVMRVADSILTADGDWAYFMDGFEKIAFTEDSLVKLALQ